MKFLLFFSVILMSCGSFACEFDLDCDYGSKCVKKLGELEGICMGGNFPGNDNDRRPFRSEDEWSRVGETCSFDLDCEIGEKCAKSRSKLEGVCVKK